MVLGVLLSLILLIFIAYRGLPVILFAPVCAIVAAVTASLPILPTYTDLFLIKAAGYIKNVFPIFLLGAVFGKVMEESGAARSIANLIIDKLGEQRAPLAVILATGALVYGGVNVTVVTFAIYPFALTMFQRGGFPRRLIPGCIAAGSLGCVMTSIPGTPTIQNMLPTIYLKTTLYAAPVFGICGSVLMGGLSIAWLLYRIKKVKAAEGFGDPDERTSKFDESMALPNAYLALVPLVVMFILNIVLTKWYKTFDPSIMIMAATKGHSLASKGIPVTTWALITSLIVAILLVIVIGRKQFHTRKNLASTLNAGTIGSLLAIMNISSEVGYGGVISSLPGFATIRDFLIEHVSGGNPLFAVVIVISVLCGITGSASGGISIALESMGDMLSRMCLDMGISLELLHRVAAMASGGLDSLPHNGSVITLLAICGLTHRKSYPDIGMVTVVIPLVTTIVMVGIWVIFGIRG